MVEIVRPHRVRVEVDTTQVHDPGQAGGIVDDDLVGRASRGERQFHRAQPLGPVLWRTFLEEELAIGTVDEALQRHRPAGDSSKRTVRHGHVVLDEVKLGVARGREVDLVGVGDRHLPAVNLQDFDAFRHVRHDSADREQRENGRGRLAALNPQPMKSVSC